MEINKVICETPEQFHTEVEKWQKKGAAPIVRGRNLIAYGEIVAELAVKRGGARPGAGRKTSTPGLNVQVAVRISEEAAQVLSEKPNKSEYVNNLILENK